ncbi:unnamed protein product, partial [Cuscuta campestris]
WADRVIKPERVHPEPTKDLEDACEKLLKGDPVTGKPYAYGGWVFRLSNPDGGASATHDAEDNRADSPDGHAEDGSPHPATHLSESDRVPYPKKDAKAKGKGTGHSSSQKRKSSHKTSRGEKRKKVRLSDLEGESIEVTFLSLAQKLSKVGVLSEEVGRSLLESKDQVSELTLLLDSAKLEINDRAEREKRLEEELKEERARLDEERANLVEAKRKLVELEDALAQAEETARPTESLSMLAFSSVSILANLDTCSGAACVNFDSKSASVFSPQGICSITYSVRSFNNALAKSLYFCIFSPLASMLPLMWPTTKLESDLILRHVICRVLANLRPPINASYSASLF